MITAAEYDISLTKHEYEIKAPEGSKPLSFQMRPGKGAKLWMLIDTSRPLVTKKFMLYATGEVIDVRKREAFKFVGTISTYCYAWHLFEVLR